MVVLQVTQADVLSALDTLEDLYPIAGALEWGNVEDACTYAEAELGGAITETLNDILQIFLEDLEGQKRKDNRRLW